MYYLEVEPLTVAVVQSHAVDRRYAGTLSARQHADIGFEFQGRLTRILVDEGEQVAAGEPLAELGTELLLNEMWQLKAQLTETRAKLKLSESSLARQKSLKSSGFTSVQQLDELEAERASLLAIQDRLNAGVSSVETRLQKSVLKAPFDGVVTRRFVDQGAVISAGVGVLRLQQTGQMEAHVGVPVKLLTHLQSGQTQSLLVNGELLSAQVLAIGADVHAVTRTVSVRLALPPGARGVNGDLVYLNLQEQVPGEGFWVPIDAVTDGIRGLWTVYGLAPEDASAAGAAPRYRVVPRDIQVDHTTATRVFVRGSFSTGELLVANGLHRLAPGQRVVLASQSVQPGVDVAAEKVAP